MSELTSYYERFLSVLTNDIDAMLENPDPTQRSPKTIAELLKIASGVEEELRKVTSSEDQWAKLSPELRAKIDELIKQELGVA